MIAKLFWFFVSTIFYTYLGYPILVALFSRVRPYRGRGSSIQRKLDSPPSVTLLIAAYNEEEVISRKLRNSLLIDYPSDKLQILVAADGSDDRTAHIVETYYDHGIELSYNRPRDGKMSAINRAITKARGDIVVFSDANNFYEPETIRELIKEFRDPSVGAVTGSKTISNGDGMLGESEGMYWKYESFIRRQETRLGNCTGVVGEVLAVRRELYEPPPDYIINDDFYMAVNLIRRGYRVVYAPQARSIERISPSVKDEVTRRTRIIAGRYQALAHAGQWMPWNRPIVVWQLISHKILRLLVPFAMIGAFVTNLVLVLRPPARGKVALFNLAPPWNGILFLLQVLFYGTSILGNRKQRKGLLGKLLYLPTFLTNSNYATLTGFYRYISKQQSNRWQRVRRRDTFDLKGDK